MVKGRNGKLMKLKDLEDRHCIFSLISFIRPTDASFVQEMVHDGGFQAINWSTSKTSSLSFSC